MPKNYIVIVVIISAVERPMLIIGLQLLLFSSQALKNYIGFENYIVIIPVHKRPTSKHKQYSCPILYLYVYIFKFFSFTFFSYSMSVFKIERTRGCRKRREEDLINSGKQDSLSLKMNPGLHFFKNVMKGYQLSSSYGII